MTLTLRQRLDSAPDGVRPWAPMRRGRRADGSRMVRRRLVPGRWRWYRI